MKELLHELAVLFGLWDVPALLQLCLRERLYPQDNGTTLSPIREAYMFGWRNIREELSGQWRSSRWTVLQPFWTGPQYWIWWEDWHHYNGTGYSIFHWVQLSCRCQTDVMVIDGHCHLDMLAWEWKTSAEGAIQRTVQQAPDRRMRLHAVVSNCCFPQFRRQIPQVSPAVGVRVALTFGVHPHVVGS